MNGSQVQPGRLSDDIQASCEANVLSQQTLWVALAFQLCFTSLSCRASDVAGALPDSDPRALTREELIGVWRRCNDRSKDCSRVDEGWWLRGDGTWAAVHAGGASPDDPMCVEEHANRTWALEPNGEVAMQGYAPHGPPERARWRLDDRPGLAWFAVKGARYGLRKLQTSHVKQACANDGDPCAEHWQCGSGHCALDKGRCSQTPMIELDYY